MRIARTYLHFIVRHASNMQHDTFSEYHSEHNFLTAKINFNRVDLGVYIVKYIAHES